jgi:cell division protein FtsZ
VTIPFSFDGARRARVAEEGLKKLREQVDTLIVIKNDRLLQLVDRHAPLQEAFAVADDILRQGIQGISDLITVPGLINMDFADVRAVMANGGAALMAVGRASGEERALAAAQQAITSPLLDITISGAKGVLFNVRGGVDLGLFEVHQAAELIRQTAAPDANMIFGAVIDEKMKDQIQITVIATGFDEEGASPAPRRPVTSDEVKKEEAPRRPFDNADLDIPSFLRRR